MCTIYIYHLSTKNRNKRVCICVPGAKGRLPQDVPLWHADYFTAESDQGPENAERNNIHTSCM